jgi:hypothetical protein
MIHVFDSSTDRMAGIAQSAPACAFVVALEKSEGPLAVYPGVERIKASAS